MTNKEKYRILCETEGARIPLFLQYWWMDCVCYGKEWDVALATLPGNNSVCAALPYLIGKRMGMRYVLQPQLTQFNGPWFNYPEREMNELDRLDFEEKASEQLIFYLKSLKLAYYKQCFSPLATNWAPFYNRGFAQTTRYTYRIPDIANLDTVFSNFDIPRRQKKIRKAELSLHVDEGLSPEAFADFHTDYWRSRGQKDLLSRDFIVRVCSTAIARNQGLILALRDNENVLRASRFVVFDSNSAYSLLSALSPDGHDNGASPLLFWEIIKRLSGRTQSFDFEGSMVPSIAFSYQLYGAVQTPYFEVSKSNSPLFSLLLKLKK